MSILSDPNAPLFSTELISPTVLSALPQGYTCRPIRRSDYHAGFLDVLRVLTTVGDVSEAQWNERYDWMSRRNDEYFLICIIDDSGRIVGTGALVVERKFIHGLGLVGHIEDIAVAKDQQGKKLGLRVIQALDFVAEKVGCYKVSLCSPLLCAFDRMIAALTGGFDRCSYRRPPDHSRLLRGQRGVLRQVRLQACRPRDGALLRHAQGLKNIFLGILLSDYIRSRLNCVHGVGNDERLARLPLAADSIEASDPRRALGECQDLPKRDLNLVRVSHVPFYWLRLTCCRAQMSHALIRTGHTRGIHAVYLISEPLCIKGKPTHGATV
ncbi:acyl-CoA N-acyltransferase, partial [Phyllosticta citrichinensis]